jgi:hypothetical protein
MTVPKGKRPRDAAQLAKWIVDQATEQGAPLAESKNAAAVALGRMGGLKGGRARADKLSSKRKSAIARKAASARWSTKGAS